MKVGVFYAYFPHGDLVDWEACLKRAKACGADHLEVSSMRLLRQEKAVRDNLVAVAKSLGMTYTFCTSLLPDADVASDDDKERRRGIEYIKRNIELVREMDGSVVGGMLHGSTYKHRPVDNETRERRMEQSAAAVREMAKTASDYGVQMGLEMCNRYENTMLNTVEQGMEFLGMVDHPSVGLHLDTYHMCIEEDDLASAILQAKGKIVNVHSCENNRKLPGMGHINWREILLALKAAGYDGALSGECFAVPFNGWTNNMYLWRDYVKDGIDEDLCRSVSYMKDLIQTLHL